MSYRSRIPQITIELDVIVDGIAKTFAERVEDRAKDRVPVDTGNLKQAIHTDRRGPAEYAVVAGNNKAFYGHIVELGGARRGARPFLVPALEETRGEINNIARAELRFL